MTHRRTGQINCCTVQDVQGVVFLLIYSLSTYGIGVKVWYSGRCMSSIDTMKNGIVYSVNGAADSATSFSVDITHAQKALAQ